jgi:oligopeptide/dipeptide ABC transporter ATP-binding protein
VLRPDLAARDQLEAAQRFTAGDVPSLLNPPQGCRYHPRCPYAQQRCREQSPALECASETDDHWVACHLWREIRALAKENHA